MRGVGQTKHLIYTLPNERCMVVTYQRNVGRAIEEFLKELRGKDFAKQVKFVTISSSDDLNKIMGYSHLIFFDHSFFDSVEEEVARKALQLAEGASIVYHTHKGNFK
jgi:hypothetical protein